MSGVSLPVTRPSGRALVVGNPASRADPADTLRRMGYGCEETDDPYAAMAELCGRPLAYRALVLSLSSLHREELAIIPGVKRRYPHVDVWLTHTDGRQAALADAMRLGADGLLSGEGLHRVALSGGSASASAFVGAGDSVPVPLQPGRAQEPAQNGPADIEPAQDAPQPATAAPAQPAEARQPPGFEEAAAPGEPVLSADELRALLQEQPAPPGAGNAD